MTRRNPISTRPDSDSPWVVFVGGFLGAGKTTLMVTAAKELEKRGFRSALVLNDQGDALVDSRYASLINVSNEEVTGGCFCCRFTDLLSSMERLRVHRPDVIFAEPVGSCTDIAATVLRPLLEYREVYRLAPLTVLVDPQRAVSLLRDNADRHLAFLFRKQIEEAESVSRSRMSALRSLFSAGPAPAKSVPGPTRVSAPGSMKSFRESC